MKKIITILSLTLVPAVSFAQNYSYRMMNGYGWQSTGDNTLGVALLFIIPLIWFVFMVTIFAFWVIMLIDAIKHAPEKTKIVWVLVIIFTHVIGALIYYFVEKRPKTKHGRKEESK